MEDFNIAFDLDDHLKVQEKEVKQFELKVDKVYQMLEELTCQDPSKVKEAEGKIDRFLAETRTEEAKRFVKIKTDRTVINKDKRDEDLKEAMACKEKGNEAFRQCKYQEAIELYTSAILINDTNPVLFTNRAQALLKIGKALDATHDCRQAIKLKPDFIKAFIHLAKALKDLGEFQEAIDTLERAEDVSNEQATVVKKYKLEMIEQQKKSFLDHQQVPKS